MQEYKASSTHLKTRKDILSIYLNKKQRKRCEQPSELIQENNAFLTPFLIIVISL